VGIVADDLVELLTDKIKIRDAARELHDPNRDINYNFASISQDPPPQLTVRRNARVSVRNVEDNQHCVAVDRPHYSKKENTPDESGTSEGVGN
jgi:hypothetical protein